MRNALRLLVSFATVCLLAPAVRADLVPPENSACNAKQAGDACNYNGAGVCQDATCSRLDYANWDHDASASPPSASYACLKCAPPATATTSSTATSTSTATATEAPSSTATSTATVTATDTKTDGSGGDDGCSIGQRFTARRVAPWLMAAAFSLLFVFGRRRRG